MDPTSRQSGIVSILESEGAASISDLAERLEVSDETVRRDLKQLEAMGYVQRYHGGVRLPENVFETPFRQRQHEQSEAKQRIGARAAELITDGMTVMIESSTTAFWVARNMTRQRNVSVITNGLEVARELCGRNNNRVYFPGGEVSSNTMSTLGPTAISFIESFTAELIIIGASGLHSEAGICDYHLPEAEIVRAMLKYPSRVAVIADSSKFEKRGLIHICNYDKIDILITDKQPPKPLAEALENVQIIIA